MGLCSPLVRTSVLLQTLLLQFFSDVRTPDSLTFLCELKTHDFSSPGILQVFSATLGVGRHLALETEQLPGSQYVQCVNYQALGMASLQMATVELLSSCCANQSNKFHFTVHMFILLVCSSRKLWLVQVVCFHGWGAQQILWVEKLASGSLRKTRSNWGTMSHCLMWQAMDEDSASSTMFCDL